MTDDEVVVATPPTGDSGDDGRLDLSIAEEFVERARAEGVDLVGPGDLLGDLTKQILETGLEVEMDEHVGYAKHDSAGRNGENSRNGTRSKTVITEVGPVDVEVPRDRDSSFEPATVKKRQRRLHGVDSMVISLTAKGLTTGEVQTHLAETFGTDVSRETISKIADRVLGDLADRPLDRAEFQRWVRTSPEGMFPCLIGLTTRCRPRRSGSTSLRSAPATRVLLRLGGSGFRRAAGRCGSSMLAA